MSETRISLDQWQALVAVVNTGGYAQAAEHLHKSQSTISYAIGQIETLLDVKVFELHGRKAVLTASGTVLYRRAQALIEEASRLERVADQLSTGWEPELRVAAEIIYPTWQLLECLETLSNQQPLLSVQLYESVLGGTAELLTLGKVDLAIASYIPPGFIGDPLRQVKFLAVAAPDHPLHQLGRTITQQDLRQHRHLIVRDSGSQPAPSPTLRVSEQRWTVTSKATSIRAACMGLGFAWFAEDIIRPELDSKALVPLPMAEGGERWATLYLVYADSDYVGPAAKELARLLQSSTLLESETMGTT